MSSRPTKVLVVDDERQIRRVMRVALEGQGYDVTDARSGEDALATMEKGLFDLVLLDLNMPGMGGMEACRRIRETSDVPIVILSVRSTEMDKVEALDAGADDYVMKPFGEKELLARIRAALRRAPVAPQSESIIVLGDLTVNLESRHVAAHGTDVRLTPKEFDVLQYLVNNPGVSIPHSRLLQAVWGPEYGGEVEYLRVFINRLRKKIEPDPANPRYIVTEPWTGYRFQPASKPAE
jgi:two-component system KDP operon response regulator KdpE